MLRLLQTNEILKEIEQHIVNSKSVSILTAFLSADAVENVFNHKNINIELFTSFHNEFVEPKGLQKLLDVNSTVYIYTGISFFHPKIYLFQTDIPIVIIGSSNFTMGGLTNNIEMNIVTDDSSIVSGIIKYIDNIKLDPHFGILTQEALSKYSELYSAKNNYYQKQPTPKLEDYSEQQKLLDYSRFKKAEESKTHSVLKLSLKTLGKESRERYGVIWIADKNVLYGNSWRFFPKVDDEFIIKFDFAGKSFSSIKTHITSSRQISGLYHKLYNVGFKLKEGDVICFEELEEKKVYRLWLEKEK